jgi:secondary thiamine-phosphate synthase enzyme
MSVYQEIVETRTREAGLIDVTRSIQGVVERAGIQTGLCTIFVQHTSASLVIQENADPAVLRDLARWLAELAPESRAWEHADEGPDDMPAHARSAVTRTTETVPVTDGRLALGTWQAIYLWEHRAMPHTRRLVVTVLGAKTTQNPGVTASEP